MTKHLPIGCLFACSLAAFLINNAPLPIQWKESSNPLTIGKRASEFAGMLKQRTFHIVWVSANHGVGIAPTGQPDVVVQYKGDAVKISSAR